MRVSDTSVAFEWYENKHSDEQCHVYLTFNEIEDAIGKLPKPEPVIIDDSRILHVWALEDDDECEDPDPENLMIPPTWYRENGTPVCAVCGQNMRYLHTILLPGKGETQPVPTKNRIVVQASGGVIQSVHADKDASVVILDHDDLMEEDGMTEDLARKIVREKVETLSQIY
jgi:hypothetical protein